MDNYKSKYQLMHRRIHLEKLETNIETSECRESWWNSNGTLEKADTNLFRYFTKKVRWGPVLTPPPSNLDAKIMLIKAVRRKIVWNGSVKWQETLRRRNDWQLRFLGDQIVPAIYKPFDYRTNETEKFHSSLVPRNRSDEERVRAEGDGGT